MRVIYEDESESLDYEWHVRVAVDVEEAERLLIEKALKHFLDEVRVITGDEDRPVQSPEAIPDRSRITTAELAEQLSKRSGVESVWIGPHDIKEIEIEGPANVLVVTD